jgi:TatD DNase family protein
MLIDTHSHIFLEEFNEDRPDVIERAKEAGVTQILLPNIDSTTISPMLSLCDKYPEMCYPMIGIHPTSVTDENYKKELKIVEDELNREDRRYIAIGEIGIDLYWDKTFRNLQIKVFERQIELAIERKLPIVIHAREACDDVCNTLDKYRDTELRGIFHSFTGTAEEAERLLSYKNFMIGVNGVVTFKKSPLPDSLQQVPMTRIVLETDSPYLTPVPFRGRRNESSYVKHVALKLAEVYETDYNTICKQTATNATKMFNLRINKPQVF